MDLHILVTRLDFSMRKPEAKMGCVSVVGPDCKYLIYSIFCFDFLNLCYFFMLEIVQTWMGRNVEEGL